MRMRPQVLSLRQWFFCLLSLLLCSSLEPAEGPFFSIQGLQGGDALTLRRQRPHMAVANAPPAAGATGTSRAAPVRTPSVFELPWRRGTSRIVERAAVEGGAQKGVGISGLNGCKAKHRRLKCGLQLLAALVAIAVAGFARKRCTDTSVRASGPKSVASLTPSSATSQAHQKKARQELPQPSQKKEKKQQQKDPLISESLELAASDFSVSLQLEVAVSPAAQQQIAMAVQSTLQQQQKGGDAAGVAPLGILYGRRIQQEQEQQESTSRRKGVCGIHDRTSSRSRNSLKTVIVVDAMLLLPKGTLRGLLLLNVNAIHGGKHTNACNRSSGKLSSHEKAGKRISRRAHQAWHLRPHESEQHAEAATELNVAAADGEIALSEEIKIDGYSMRTLPLRALVDMPQCALLSSIRILCLGRKQQNEPLRVSFCLACSPWPSIPASSFGSLIALTLLLQLLQKASNNEAALLLLRDFALLMHLQRHLAREKDLVALCSAVKAAAASGAASCLTPSDRSSSSSGQSLPGPLFRLLQRIVAAGMA
ncbi:hypothetical protein cyc_04182 [Cyclospora cayetanensis]|uniref:Uncharacterized protein n=1 Tax=Cyclospora cayetanensis TaxID=88456 RepID=A0A1D3CRX2_9EIME|nr:hypothetical protein cyc_04182 [Cyclospora cayetanensis]